MSGKKYKSALAKVDREKRYSLVEALELLPQVKYSKWDETVDVAIRLGVDPKQTDQMVRGAAPLPHGLGKSLRVIVFAKGDKQKEAKEAGADEVGAEDLVQKIEQGWLGFDQVIATPDVMGLVSKLGRVLGPRGLMPNPKLGTVTFEVGKAIKEVKAGKAEFKIDKGAVVHSSFGKISFGSDKLKDNFKVLLEAVMRAKPQTSKGIYLRSVTLSTTMSPGIKLDTNLLQTEMGL